MKCKKLKFKQKVMPSVPHSMALCKYHYVFLSPVDNRVNVCIHDTTGWQIGCTTQFDYQLNEQLFVQHGCQTSCTTGLTTGCIVYTNIQPVVKPCLSNRLYNPVVSCKRGFIVTKVLWKYN